MNDATSNPGKRAKNGESLEDASGWTDVQRRLSSTDGIVIRADALVAWPSRGVLRCSCGPGVRLRGGAGALLCCRRSLLAALDGLRAVLLGEALDAAFGVDQLLAAREERMTFRADLEVQLVLGRSRFPRRAARAPGGHFVIL